MTRIPRPKTAKGNINHEESTSVFHPEEAAATKGLKARTSTGEAPVERIIAIATEAPTQRMSKPPTQEDDLLVGAFGVRTTNNGNLEVCPAGTSDDHHVDDCGEEEGEPSVPQDPDTTAVELPSLPVATPVDRTENLPEAQEWANLEIEGNHERNNDSRSNKAKQMSRTIFGIALVIMAVVVVIVMVVFLRPSSNSNETTDVEEKIHASQLSKEYVVSLLPEYSVEALEDTTSPQFMAFDWILGDPSLLAYPSWRVLQRFALVTLYYATGTLFYAIVVQSLHPCVVLNSFSPHLPCMSFSI